MNITRRETALAIAIAVLCAIAGAGPHVGLALGYHDFADQRDWHAIPNAGDVLSNLGFLVAGLAGALCLWRVPPRAITNMECAMSALFFAGLVLTAASSSWYHLRPDDARLAIDRCGMVFAFAGLLGLSAATHVSERAGAFTGLGWLMAGLWTIRTAADGEMLPWAVVQAGGVALLCAATWLEPLPHALRIRWLVIVAIYTAAKLAEINDATVFELTRHALSGHTLKHLIAAFSAWPLIAALRGCACVQNDERDSRRVSA